MQQSQNTMSFLQIKKDQNRKTIDVNINFLAAAACNISAMYNQNKNPFQECIE